MVLSLLATMPFENFNDIHSVGTFNEVVCPKPKGHVGQGCELVLTGQDGLTSQFMLGEVCGRWVKKTCILTVF